jgi:hypothetical protein
VVVEAFQLPKSCIDFDFVIKQLYEKHLMLYEFAKSYNQTIEQVVEDYNKTKQQPKEKAAVFTRQNSHNSFDSVFCG